MYKIAKENLSALFQSIAENQELYLPVEVSGQVNFKASDPGCKRISGNTENRKISERCLLPSEREPVHRTERGKETEHRTAGTQRTELCSIRYESL